MISIGFILSLAISTTAWAGTPKTEPQINVYDGVSWERPTCYQRAYDAIHLSRHPRQTVQTIGLRLIKSPQQLDSENKPSHEFFVDVDVRIRNDGPRIRSFEGVALNGMRMSERLQCREEEDRSAKCWIDCDGGGFNLIRTDRGTLVLDNRGLKEDGSWPKYPAGFGVKASCGEERKKQVSHFIKGVKGGDDLFYTFQNPPDPRLCRVPSDLVDSYNQRVRAESLPRDRT